MRESLRKLLDEAVEVCSTYLLCGLKERRNNWDDGFLGLLRICDGKMEREKYISRYPRCAVMYKGELYMGTEEGIKSREGNFT